MRTEIELLDAMDELAAEAPDTQLLMQRLTHRVAPPSRPSSLRRRLLPASGAAIAVVAAAALVVALTRDSTPTGHSTPVIAANGPTTEHPCAAGASTTLMTFTVSPVAGIDVRLDALSACSGYATRQLYLPGGAALASISLFAPGVFDTSSVRGVSPVTEGKITGFPVQVPAGSCANPARPAACPPSSPIVPSPGKTAGLAWQYAPDAWAVLRIDRSDPSDAYFAPDPVAKELKIAAAVRVDLTPTLSLPMKLRYLPGGTLPVTVSRTSGPAARDGGASTGGIDLGVRNKDASCPGDQVCSEQVSLSVAASTETSTAPGWPGRPLTVNGHPATVVTPTTRFPGPHVLMATGRWYVDLSATPASGITADDLVRILQGMTFAPSTSDVSTWFSLDQVWPR